MSVVGKKTYRPRGLIARLLLILPLLQALAPLSAALSNQSEGWCRTLAGTTGSNDPNGTRDRLQPCLVCAAIAIGANAMPAAPSETVAPRLALLSRINGTRVEQAEPAMPVITQPIRAPPPGSVIRLRDRRAQGCALT